MRETVSTIRNVDGLESLPINYIHLEDKIPQIKLKIRNIISFVNKGLKKVFLTILSTFQFMDFNVLDECGFGCLCAAKSLQHYERKQ